METRNLKQVPHLLTRIETWLKSQKERGKPLICPVCRTEESWKWADEFQIPFFPTSLDIKPFAVLTCNCGYTVFVQPTPENGLKLDS